MVIVAEIVKGLVVASAVGSKRIRIQSRLWELLWGYCNNSALAGSVLGEVVAVDAGDIVVGLAVDRDFDTMWVLAGTYVVAAACSVVAGAGHSSVLLGLAAKASGSTKGV